MRTRRLSQAIAVIAVAGLGLTACSASTGGSNSSSSSTGSSSASSSASDSSSAPAANGGSVTVAETNAFSSFNPNTAQGNVDINSKIGYTTSSSWAYVNDKLEIVKNDKFGSYEKVSDNPLKVKFTVNKDVKWSDGTAFTADDIVLLYAMLSGKPLDAKGEAPMFPYAGDTTGWAATKTPVVSDDNQSVEFEFTTPFADWEGTMATFGLNTAAHVIAKKAGYSDVKDMTKDILAGSDGKGSAGNDKLTAAAKFWNTGYNTTSMPTDKDLYLSNGPYIVDAIDPDKSLTLKKNPDYTWGPEAHLDSIVVRYIGDANAMVQALQNGEVDIAAPQPSADTLTSLEALSDTVNVDKGAQLAYDHIDLSFDQTVFKDKNVREAFLKTIPRQEILNAIQVPLDPEAKVLNSQIFVPSQGDVYNTAVGSNDSSQYGDVDIDGAKKLLDGATPTVRIMYNKDNPNRANSFQLISQSAAKAGFKIVDGGLGASKWGDALGNGTYDATIFGWTNPGINLPSNVSQLFKSKNASNFNKYSNADVDKLLDTLIKTTDLAEQQKIETEVDKHLFDDAYGLPLFQSTAVQAYNKKVQGTVFMSNQTGVWWNFWDWSVSGS